MTSADQKDIPPIVFVVLAAAIVGGALVLAASRPAPPAIVIKPPPPTATPGPVRVYVSGAVSRPDVYTLPWGAIVKDAVQAAGGLLENGDAARVNMARRLQDGEQVHVPVMGGAEPAAVEPDAVPSRVPVNSANREALETLPGIGPSLAQRIIDHRETHGPFTSLEQVMDVPGIGPVTFDKLKDLMTLD